MTEMAVAYERHRITLEEYHRMVGAGVFGDDARIELIAGELVTMPPIGLPRYASGQVFAESESISPIAFPEERFVVGDLLPPR